MILGKVELSLTRDLTKEFTAGDPLSMELFILLKVSSVFYRGLP